MLGQSISKNSFILGSFALITAGVLAYTFFLTKEKIIAEEERAAKRALLELVPREQHDNDMLSDVYALSPAEHNHLGLDPASMAVIHIARKKGEPVAAIIPSVAADGYSGAIKMIIGINANNSLAGVRVLSHKETPGLGDKIDLNKSDWILTFDGKSLASPTPDKWAVKKDGGVFDQFTGATITPRAVIKQVKHTLEYFQTNNDSIFENTPSINRISEEK